MDLALHKNKYYYIIFFLVARGRPNKDAGVCVNVTLNIDKSYFFIHLLCCFVLPFIYEEL